MEHSHKATLLLAAALATACLASREPHPSRATTEPQAGHRMGGGTAAAPVASEQEKDRTRLLEIGRGIFIEKCASCHNERGDKPLASGPPLNQRKLTPEEILRNASGRLRSRTDEEKRAVALYIQSFQKK